MVATEIPTGPRADERPPGAVSPWWVVGAFAAVAVGALAFRLPARGAAAGLLLLLGIAVARHPANGVVALVLAAPFVLGEHKTPYFLLLHAAAVGVIGSFVAHRAAGRLAFVPSHASFALLLVAAAVGALPLDLRDLLEDLWLSGSLDWVAMLNGGIVDVAPLKYLERVLVLALGVGLFLIAAQPTIGHAVLRALPPLALVVGILAGFGLLRYADAIKTGGDYLTLSFWTWAHPERRLTAVAWNPDYLSQFLAVVLPVLVAFAWIERRPWVRRAALAAAAMGGLALVFTLQRAGYVTLVLGMAVLLVLARRAECVPSWRPLAVLGGLMLGTAALLDAFVLGGPLVERLGRLFHEPHRGRLWLAALRMVLAHPLLGVGTGRYAPFFHEYATPEERAGFGPFWGTAHNLYLHVAAEQGLLGLGALLTFFGGVWVGTLRRLARLDGERRLLTSGLLAALASWLAYGLVQFTFRVDGLTYLVFILAGTTLSLASPDRPRWPSRRAVLAGAVLILAVVAVRVEAGLRRPVSPGYEAGFYRWERQPDGSAARWTRGRAAMSVPVQGRVLELPLRAPIPGIDARPQVVRVWIDRRPRVVRLAGRGWEAVLLPVAASRGQHVLVELEVSYTFVPSRLGASSDDRRLGVMIGAPVWRDA